MAWLRVVKEVLSGPILWLLWSGTLIQKTKRFHIKSHFPDICLPQSRRFTMMTWKGQWWGQHWYRSLDKLVLSIAKTSKKARMTMVDFSDHLKLSVICAEMVNAVPTSASLKSSMNSSQGWTRCAASTPLIRSVLSLVVLANAVKHSQLSMLTNTQLSLWKQQSRMAKTPPALSYANTHFYKKYGSLSNRVVCFHSREEDLKWIWHSLHCVTVGRNPTFSFLAFSIIWKGRIFAVTIPKNVLYECPWNCLEKWFDKSVTILLEFQMLFAFPWGLGNAENTGLKLGVQTNDSETTSFQTRKRSCSLTMKRKHVGNKLSDFELFHQRRTSSYRSFDFLLVFDGIQKNCSSWLKCSE